MHTYGWERAFWGCWGWGAALLQARLLNQQLDEQKRSSWRRSLCPTPDLAILQMQSLEVSADHSRLTKQQLSGMLPVRSVLGKTASQSEHCPASGGCRHVADIVKSTSRALQSSSLVKFRCSGILGFIEKVNYWQGFGAHLFFRVL